MSSSDRLSLPAPALAEQEAGRPPPLRLTLPLDPPISRIGTDAPLVEYGYHSGPYSSMEQNASSTAPFGYVFLGITLVTPLSITPEPTF